MQQVVALVSLSLLDAETRHGTTEKELTIMYLVTKFRVYLTEQHCHIITDTKGLTFLNESVYSNGRLKRWRLIMQQFSFDVSYCKGSDNVVADLFSRHLNGYEYSTNQQQVLIDVLAQVCVHGMVR